MTLGHGVRGSLAALWLVLAVPGWLVGCGGSGGGGTETPAYALDIDPPAAASTSANEAVLTGHGFLPPDSTCNGDCAGPLPPPVFGQLGPYSLGWRNEASGETGVLHLAWVCNCGGGAPYWIGRVPLAPGANRITITMSAGGYSQTARVDLNRV